MNWTAQERLLGHKRVRKTWKHTLSPEKNAERVKQMQFCKRVRKALGGNWVVSFYFNSGGPAVWGETYVKIQYIDHPVVEACLSHDFSYIRQWDGRHSGHNRGVRYGAVCDIGNFVSIVRELASKPFVRF